MFFELFEEHLDLPSLEGECRANESEFFLELSRFFIQIERGVPDMFSFLTVFVIFLPDSQLKPNTCETLFSCVGTSFTRDEYLLLASVSERWV